MRKAYLFMVLAATATVLPGCATRMSDTYEPGVSYYVEPELATVLDVRKVEIRANDARDSALAAVTGSLVGALLGNTAAQGVSNVARLAVAGVSGVVGATAAQYVNNAVNSENGVNIIYRTRSGDRSVAV